MCKIKSLSKNVNKKLCDFVRLCLQSTVKCCHNCTSLGSYYLNYFMQLQLPNKGEYLDNLEVIFNI